jgi:cell division protein FtsL
MFIGMLSLFYLVYDMKTRIGEQEEKIESLELEVRNASKIIAELKESNGLLKAELQTRKELNNIR